MWIKFEKKEIIYTFEENIKELDNHKGNEETMKFWNTHKEAYNHITKNQNEYRNVFKKLSDELKQLANKYTIIFIAQPSCFDWMFLKSYYELARQDDKEMYDIGYKCICISSYWDGIKKITKKSNNILKQNKALIPNEYRNVEHTPLYDAIEQGMYFINMLNDN